MLIHDYTTGWLTAGKSVARYTMPELSELGAEITYQSPLTDPLAKSSHQIRPIPVAGRVTLATGK